MGAAFTYDRRTGRILDHRGRPTENIKQRRRGLRLIQRWQRAKAKLNWPLVEFYERVLVDLTVATGAWSNARAERRLLCVADYVRATPPVLLLHGKLRMGSYIISRAEAEILRDVHEEAITGAVYAGRPESAAVDLVQFDRLERALAEQEQDQEAQPL
ncbi:MAG TPA: hypothetical protein VFB02_13710 [Bradyrhizobium sp.]|nr:hypothetical protein [Bradyrhizobium sp.]